VEYRKDLKRKFCAGRFIEPAPPHFSFKRKKENVGARAFGSKRKRKSKF
jgi:hypothetical protein